MKLCLDCEKTFGDELEVCPHCGSETVCKALFCPSCGTANINGDKFCMACGAAIGGETTQEKSVGIADRIKDNEFVKSVKGDFANSQTIDMIKSKIGNKSKKSLRLDKVSSVSRRKKIIACVAVLVTVVGIVFACITHTCENCGSVYFGKKYYRETSHYGNTYYIDVCRDCYLQYYGPFARF